MRKAQSSEYKVLIEDYLKEFNTDAYELAQKNRELFEKSLPLVQERMKKLSEYWELCRFYFIRPSEYDIDMALHKDALLLTSSALERLTVWNAKQIGEAMQTVCETHDMKRSDYFMMMRVAITGRKVSPPLNESMELLGKKECLTRLKSA